MGISAGRLSATSLVSFGAGSTNQILLSITPDSGGTAADFIGTMWQSSFEVVGFTSISVPNATNILLGCNLTAAEVGVVNGTLVQFKSNNNMSAGFLQCLAGNGNVDGASIAMPCMIGHRQCLRKPIVSQAEV